MQELGSDRANKRATLIKLLSVCQATVEWRDTSRGKTKMERDQAFETQQVSFELQQVASQIRKLAQAAQGDSLELLALLRVLEGLHREICEGLFQESLPNNRRALYSLLKDIETQGGWPYIHRMRLHSFLDNLPNEEGMDGHAGSDQESETKS
ncbi:hypothetical protein [Phormidesmis priestleyi]